MHAERVIDRKVFGNQAGAHRIGMAQGSAVAPRSEDPSLSVGVNLVRQCRNTMDGALALLPVAVQTLSLLPGARAHVIAPLPSLWQFLRSLELPLVVGCAFVPWLI